jgi:AmmeMemoRadiSam system protein B
MEKNNSENKKLTGRLILACFLVFSALAAGLAMAYLFFSDSALKIAGNKAEIKFHSANPDKLSFYENFYEFSRREISFAEAPVAGVIPHHLLAGDLIAEFFSNLEKYDYDTIILLGPNHFSAGTGKIITSAEDWQTPYGVLPADSNALKTLTNTGGVSVEEDIFKQEHSIYGEVAFIKKTFPHSKFLPLVLRPELKSAEAEDLAKKLHQISLTKKILVISSTDFSHYKTSAEAQADDAKSLEILKNYSFSDVYNMAVDSPPSTYVLMKYAGLCGADFIKLNNSNSALLAGRDDIESTTSYITGYFGKNSPLERGGCAAQPGCVNAFLPSAADAPLKLLFFGDLMLDRHVGEKIKASGGLDWIFSGLNDAGIFQGNDIISANLEGAVTDNGAHYPPVKVFDFAFDPITVQGLAEYNFNFFNIANNHLADQGKNGIIETENNITNLGFAFSGCPDREVDACTAELVKKNGRSIDFIGASMVYGALDENRLIEETERFVSSTDLVVVQMHWGTEYQHEPNKNQIELAHKLIDAGADFIIGHHPHVVGGIEIYKNKPIFYSLGNFVFDQYFSVDTQEELGVRISAGGKNFQINLLPIKSEAGRLRLMNDQEKNNFFAKLAGWSIGDKDFKNEIKSGRLEINN